MAEPFLVLTSDLRLSYNHESITRRLSQVVRRRSAKPLYGGSNPPAASSTGRLKSRQCEIAGFFVSWKGSISSKSPWGTLAQRIGKALLLVNLYMLELLPGLLR